MGTYKWRYYPTARKYLVVNCLWSFHLELWTVAAAVFSRVIFRSQRAPSREWNELYVSCSIRLVYFLLLSYGAMMLFAFNTDDQRDRTRPNEMKPTRNTRQHTVGKVGEYYING